LFSLRFPLLFSDFQFLFPLLPQRLRIRITHLRILLQFLRFLQQPIRNRHVFLRHRSIRLIQFRLVLHEERFPPPLAAAAPSAPPDSAAANTYSHSPTCTDCPPPSAPLPEPQPPPFHTTPLSLPVRERLMPEKLKELEEDKAFILAGVERRREWHRGQATPYSEKS
jgi:hypothetical protein